MRLSPLSRRVGSFNVLLVVVACGASPLPVEHEESDADTAVGVHPCDVLVPRARRSLAPMLRTIGAEPDSERSPFTDCFRDGDAAWMFFPRGAAVEWVRPHQGNLPDMPTNEAVPVITIPYQLVYASGDRLIAGEPQTHTDDPLNVSTDLIDVKSVSDIDGDGRAELAVIFSETVWEDPHPARYVIYTAGESVTEYPPAAGIPVSEYRDVDEDGRLDIISDSVWSAIMCGNDPPPAPMPPVLHHAQEDGTFATSSHVAAGYLRTHCPSSPGTLVSEHDLEYGTLLNVSCARAWGASVDEVRAQLRREYPRRSEDDNYCAYHLEETLEWAAIEPPVRLDLVR